MNTSELDLKASKFGFGGIKTVYVITYNKERDKDPPEPLLAHWVSN